MLSYPPGAWVLAARILRREPIDIIHSHFAVPTGPASLASANLAGIPHVLSIHGGDIGEAVFEATFDRIDRCLGVLYTTLW